jgi:hypothetical protein
MSTKMRSRRDIQKIHDLLQAALDIRIDGKPMFRPATETAVRYAQDILCWVLNHDHETFFEGNVEHLLDQLEEAADRADPIITGEVATKYVC